MMVASLEEASSGTGRRGSPHEKEPGDEASPSNTIAGKHTHIGRL